MKWRKLRNGTWAFGPMRCRQNALKHWEVWNAQVELPFGQAPIPPRKFTTLTAAKKWGKAAHEGTE